MQIVAEPRRQAILQLIWEQERSAGEISGAFEVSFSAISQHLSRLREAGIVKVRRDGRQRFYRAHKEALGSLADYFENLWGKRLGRLKPLAEAEERNSSEDSKS